MALGLLIGAAVDDLMGDPRRAHPVAGYGRLVTAFEQRLHADDVRRGAWFVGAVTVPLLLACVAVERSVRHRPAKHTALVAAATWCALGGTSLTRVGERMARLLEDGRTDAARELLPSLCGRDPASLDDAGLARATVESIAENTSDAVVAPLVWGALAGVPGLLGYRAVNTLDAMVGHRSPRYARFGTAAARLDDVLNLLPARVTAALTLLAAPVVHGSAREGWTAWRRDAGNHPSPNAGPCEASAAGVLGVRLGGVTVYGGRAENRPQLGTGRLPTVADIARAARLSRAVQHAAVAVCVAAAAVVGRNR
ncbi:cobalamin biosynthesis protein [uncultured Jatrophihabitans sp.]|uniref:cobalamin biosynthesis protein n=1 Tax=uncultured Jatrophihabitans sp. TaxID=1610747 RepID=UPI0035C9C5C2